jgi:hypothetical protein
VKVTPKIGSNLHSLNTAQDYLVQVLPANSVSLRSRHHDDVNTLPCCLHVSESNLTHLTLQLVPSNSVTCLLRNNETVALQLIRTGTNKQGDSRGSDTLTLTHGQLEVLGVCDSVYLRQHFATSFALSYKYKSNSTSLI